MTSEAKFYNQSRTPILEVIQNHASQYDSVSIATAYLSADALELLEEQIGDKGLRILCGIHGSISDLWSLQDYVQRDDLQVAGKVFTGVRLFHPKLYIFEGSNQVSMITGSPNFTAGGMKNNEEVCVEIVGSPSDKPVQSAIKYFDEIWMHKSVSVERYLNNHPAYESKPFLNAELTTKQEQVLNTLKEEAAENGEFSFENQVIQTLYRHGRQTIPTRLNDQMDEFNLMAEGESVPFDITLPNGSVVEGKIRYGRSSWGLYYEIGVRAQNVNRLQNSIEENDVLEYRVDLKNRIVEISHTS